jgi:hypothetical protein
MILRFIILSGLKRVSVLLFMAGLFVVGLAGWLQRAPGYMDADYYYSGGILFLSGSGLRQPLIWNYLDAPMALPVQAYSYWMPLAALLSAAGSAIGREFFSARLPFWLIAAAVPPITLHLGLALHGERRKAILGGIFALVPVFYLAYLPTTDVFAVYMLLGSSILILMQKAGNGLGRWFSAGLLAGLMHLARVDGLFWLAGVLLMAGGPVLAGLRARRRPVAVDWLAVGKTGLAVLTGYLAPMSLWYLRNLQVWGWIFPPGTGRTLWLTRYEDTFVFPASLLTSQRWLAAGIGPILAVRGEALMTNLQTLLAVQGSIVLLPFILIGLWRLRRLRSVCLGAGMWLATFGLMTVVFPYAGINGSFFHSGAAIQPLFWAAAPIGIEVVIGWLAAKRGWRKGGQVLRFVEGLLIATCLVLSLLMYFQRVAGVDDKGLAWNHSDVRYRLVESKLVDFGAKPGEVVMVNNPPGYYAAVQRPGVVIPFGDEAMLREAAAQFGARYLILEENDAGHLAQLFSTPGDIPGLKYLGEVEGTKLYAIAH